MEEDFGLLARPDRLAQLNAHGMARLQSLRLLLARQPKNLSGGTSIQHLAARHVHESR